MGVYYSLFLAMAYLIDMNLLIPRIATGPARHSLAEFTYLPFPPPISHLLRRELLALTADTRAALFEGESTALVQALIPVLAVGAAQVTARVALPGDLVVLVRALGAHKRLGEAGRVAGERQVGLLRHVLERPARRRARRRYQDPFHVHQSAVDPLADEMSARIGPQDFLLTHCE